MEFNIAPEYVMPFEISHTPSERQVRAIEYYNNHSEDTFSDHQKRMISLASTSDRHEINKLKRNPDPQYTYIPYTFPDINTLPNHSKVEPSKRKRDAFEMTTISNELCKISKSIPKKKVYIMESDDDCDEHFEPVHKKRKANVSKVRKIKQSASTPKLIPLGKKDTLKNSPNEDLVACNKCGKMYKQKCMKLHTSMCKTF